MLTQAGLERGVVYAVDLVQLTSGDYSAGVSYDVHADAAQSMPNDIQYATTLAHVDANGRNREWPFLSKGFSHWRPILPLETGLICLQTTFSGYGRVFISCRKTSTLHLRRIQRIGIARARSAQN
jgi:hypothetical protein